MLSHFCDGNISFIFFGQENVDLIYVKNFDAILLQNY